MRARRCSGQLVTSRVPTRIRPASTGKEPAIAPSRLDLPEPLLPITITNDPGAPSRSMPWGARPSFAGPDAKVLRTPFRARGGALLTLASDAAAPTSG